MKTRRGFLKSALAAGLGLLLLPIGRGAQAKKLAIKLDKLPQLQRLGGWTVAKIKDRQVLLIRDAEESVRALSAVCTHQKCLVAYEPASKSIQCGCHKSGFDLDGKVIGGPAPVPLPRFKSWLKDGRVILDFEADA